VTEQQIAELREIAEEAARRAGKVLMERFPKKRTIEFKGGIDLVTDADKAAEREILSFIKAEFPEHNVLAEESGLTKGAEYRWIVDPLDGTTNYAHQVPHFCISIAVEGPGGLLAGVVYDPMRDELFSASRGGGTWLNGKRVRASGVAELHQALMSTGFPYDVRENPAAPVGLFTQLIQVAQGIRRMGAAALDLAYVAAGRLDGYFEIGLYPWDMAAGCLLVREAGGRYCDFMGRDGLPGTGNLVAGNVLVANAMIKTMAPEVTPVLAR
jgi:myo-inositol-1(or 4)-monophosphatase